MEIKVRPVIGSLIVKKMSIRLVMDQSGGAQGTPSEPLIKRNQYIPNEWG